MYHHRATILLHDPHANLDDLACPSRVKLRQASRSIVELIHLISSTTYDVSLLDHFTIVSKPAYYSSRGCYVLNPISLLL